MRYVYLAAVLLTCRPPALAAGTVMKIFVNLVRARVLTSPEIGDEITDARACEPRAMRSSRVNKPKSQFVREILDSLYPSLVKAMILT
jgi:hypothetical protein